MHPNVRNPDGCNGILVRPVGRGCSNAIINTLKQCQLLNENLKWLSEEVALFDQFQLDNGEYISPGIYGSNLNATYYADQFISVSVDIG